MRYQAYPLEKMLQHNQCHYERFPSELSMIYFGGLGIMVRVPFLWYFEWH